MNKNKVYKVAEYVEINPGLFDEKNNSYIGENINIMDSKNLESIAFIFSKIWRNSNELIYSLKNNSILIYTYSNNLIRPDNLNYFLYKDLIKSKKELERTLNKEEKIEILNINLDTLWDNLKTTKSEDVKKRIKKFIDDFIAVLKRSRTINFDGKIPGFLLLAILKLSIPHANNIYYKDIKVK
jgi:hypothetical protein